MSVQYVTIKARGRCFVSRSLQRHEIFDFELPAPRQLRFAKPSACAMCLTGLTWHSMVYMFVLGRWFLRAVLCTASISLCCCWQKYILFVQLIDYRLVPIFWVDGTNLSFCLFDERIVLKEVTHIRTKILSRYCPLNVELDTRKHVVLRLEQPDQIDHH